MKTIVPLGILFDLDGVIYNADRLIDGAVETIAWVRSERIPHLFVTNTTSKSRADIASKLSRFGIPASADDIFAPAMAAAEYLRERRDGAVAVFVPPGALSDFDGLEHVPDHAEDGASYVVIGDLGHRWDFRALNRAFRLLHSNPEANLIALGMTRYWMASDGISLDVAPFVAALEHATGRKALVFGKPAEAFFHAAAARLNLEPGQILMIGDDIEADVGGAQAAGLETAFVKTGKFRAADLTRGIRPGAVLGSIAELPDWWTQTLRDVHLPE